MHGSAVEFRLAGDCSELKVCYGYVVDGCYFILRTHIYVCVCLAMIAQRGRCFTFVYIHFFPHLQILVALVVAVIQMPKSEQVFISTKKNLKQFAA